MRRLMWFRSDLRLDDNPALRSACHQATEGVIAVFAVTPQQWAAHHWGDAKVSFVMRHVSELRAALEKINIPLKILRSNTFDMIPDQLLRLARSHHCHRLCFNAEWEVHEQYRDQQTTQKFEAAGLEVLCTRDQTLIRPDDLKTGSGGYYTVFTPFKKKWLAMASQQAAETPHGAPPRQKAIAVKADPLPDRHKGFRPCPAIDALWPAGEREAHRRLKCFLKDHADRYHIQRDRPDRAGTSSLSAYLAAGVISIRRVFCAAVKANRGRFSGGRKGLDLWISELIWREFYRHVLVGFPRVCRNQAFKRQSESLPWSNSPELFAAWCAGRTGFPIVDAGMRQLNATGWMHNRLRMITAMFLTKDLLIDWRLRRTLFCADLGRPGFRQQQRRLAVVGLHRHRCRSLFSNLQSNQPIPKI